jgi:HPt (histidine-containing phosphotransfer) domain-containing protein
MKGDRERCLEAGMDDYLTKPVKVRDLLQLIGRLVRSDGTSDGESTTGRIEADFSDRLLHDRFDGDLELLREVAGSFLESSPPLLSAMRDAVAAGDPRSVSQLAHRLRGSLANFGAEEAVEAAFRLERMGVEGDLADADQPCRTLLEEYDALRIGLERLLAGRDMAGGPAPTSAAEP